MLSVEPHLLADELPDDAARRDEGALGFATVFGVLIYLRWRQPVRGARGRHAYAHPRNPSRAAYSSSYLPATNKPPNAIKATARNTSMAAPTDLIDLRPGHR